MRNHRENPQTKAENSSPEYKQEAREYRQHWHKQLQWGLSNLDQKDSEVSIHKDVFQYHSKGNQVGGLFMSSTLSLPV